MDRYTFRELVIDSRTGLNPRKNFTLGNGNNYYITIKDIHDGKIVITDKTDRVDDAAVAIIKKRSRIKNGDILFTSIGRIGETAIVTNKDDTWDVNESVFIFTLNTDLITQEYFCALFQSQNVQDQLTRDSSGSTFKSIKMNQLEKMSFDIPCLEEQKKISNVLNETNKLISLRKEQLAKLDQLVKSRFIELFGDPAINEKGWIIRNLENVTTVVTYGLTVRPEYIAEGIDLVSARELHKGFIDYNAAPKISENDFEKLSEKGKPQKNDILFSKTGSIGHCALVTDDKPFAITQNAARIGLKSETVNPLWLLYYLRMDYIQDWCKEHAKGNAVKDFQLQDMKVIPLFDCPLELQNQFTSFVEQVDKSKLAIQQSLDKLETLKKSLMQEYFG